MQAILCLQSDACFEALEIDWPKIRERALEHGVVMTRVSVRDFDHNDQARLTCDPHRLLRTSFPDFEPSGAHYPSITQPPRS